MGGDSAPAAAGWHGHLGPLERQWPGTARLFYELGLGRNFTDIREPGPGIFSRSSGPMRWGRMNAGIP